MCLCVCKQPVWNTCLEHLLFDSAKTMKDCRRKLIQESKMCVKIEWKQKTGATLKCSQSNWRLNMVSFVLTKSQHSTIVFHRRFVQSSTKKWLNLVSNKIGRMFRLCSKNRGWQREWRDTSHTQKYKTIPNGPLNVGTLYFFVDEMCIATNCDSQHCFVWLRGRVFASYYMRFYYWPLALCIRRDNNMLITYRFRDDITSNNIGDATRMRMFLSSFFYFFFFDYSRDRLIVSLFVCLCVCMFVYKMFRVAMPIWWYEFVRCALIEFDPSMDCATIKMQCAMSFTVIYLQQAILQID